MKYVYVISVGEEFSKVGVASCLEDRLKKLQACCPLKLTLFSATSFADNARAFLIETTAHKMLQEYSVHGEWFRVSPQQASEIVSEIVSGLEQDAKRLTDFPEEQLQPRESVRRRLVCPECSHSTPILLDNATIWRSVFRCSRCKTRVPGRRYFIRRVA